MLGPMNQPTAGGMWRPRGLPVTVTDEDLAGFVYAVVEERIDEILSLIVTAWPGARDEQPVFAGSGEGTRSLSLGRTCTVRCLSGTSLPRRSSRLRACLRQKKSSVNDR